MGINLAITVGRFSPQICANAGPWPPLHSASAFETEFQLLRSHQQRRNFLVFWLEPKVFICNFLDEVLVYFDFEAYFHSPDAADGLLMRNHLRGFGNGVGWVSVCEGAGWSQLNKQTKQKIRVCPIPRLRIWPWLKWKQMLHFPMVQL